MSKLPMKVSGFTLVRNAFKATYPLKESITSILPLCDEFVINIGESEDGTEKLIDELVAEHPEVEWKVIHTKWDLGKRKSGLILSEHTNIALEKCTGDWCFYIQADEVVHEDDLPAIRQALLTHHENSEVEGLKLYWKHFAGSLFTYESSVGCYNQEIRLFRRGIGVESWGDAQSFRMKDQRPLKCKTIDADIYHYSHAKSEEKMLQKIEAVGTWWHDDSEIKEKQREWIKKKFHRMENLIVYEWEHPRTMKGWIENADWSLTLKDFILTGVEKVRVYLKNSDEKYARLIEESLKKTYPQTTISIRMEKDLGLFPFFRKKTFDLGLDLIGTLGAYWNCKSECKKTLGYWENENFLKKYAIRVNTINRFKKVPARPLKPGEHLSKALSRIGCPDHEKKFIQLP